MDEFQKIYDETLKEKKPFDAGYLVSFRPISNKHSFVAIQTMCIGIEKNKDIRRADLSKTVSARAHYKLLNYPLLCINNIEELSSFLRIGGHAIVKPAIIETNWNEILNPRIVVDTYEEGFIDYKTIEQSHKSRFARGKLRMEIFERDNYCCKICGSSPDDGVHVKIEAHHIKPWEEGGISSPENLITLCKTCHEGIDIVSRELLYKKIGLYFPYSENKLFKESINWNRVQRRSFSYLLSNTVTFRIAYKPRG